jgi:hypothetical protein
MNHDEMQTRNRNITLPQGLLSMTRQFCASNFVIRHNVSVWGKINSHEPLHYKTDPNATNAFRTLLEEQ